MHQPAYMYAHNTRAHGHIDTRSRERTHYSRMSWRTWINLCRQCLHSCIELSETLLRSRKVMCLDKNKTCATKSKQRGTNQKKGEKSERGWRQRWEETGRSSDTNLFHFSRHGPKSPLRTRKDLKKNSPRIGWQLVLPVGTKVLPSLLSSARLLTVSWSLFMLSFPSVSAEAAAQTQAAILYSAVSRRTRLEREIPEVWRGVFQNKSATPTETELYRLYLQVGPQ